jgi:hypothetical protein
MMRIGRAIYGLMYEVDDFLDSHFRCQLALAATIARIGISCEALLPRYNFVNHGPLETKLATELKQARFLHINGPTPVPKEDLFADLAHLEEFVRTPGQHGFGRKLQEVLKQVVSLIRAEDHRFAACALANAKGDRADAVA